MKTKLCFILFFSLSFFWSFAQKQDSIKIKKNHYKPNFLVGLDVLNAGISAFSDRKLFQGFVSSKIKDRWYLILDTGYDKNIYQKNGYNANVKGVFVKTGAYYMMVQDPENEKNGFYIGIKIAGSFYKQEYLAVPIRGYGGGDFSLSFPPSSQSSYWLEAYAGARVKLFKSNFYIDVNVQPRYMIYTTKQNQIYPMVVPGFGKSSTKFNTGFSWNLAYYF